MVKQWHPRHQAELLANWQYAERFDTMERNPGAD